MIFPRNVRSCAVAGLEAWALNEVDYRVLEKQLLIFLRRLVGTPKVTLPDGSEAYAEKAILAATGTEPLAALDSLQQEEEDL